MKHIVSLSGGIGSYITLKRVISIHPCDTIAVFCDTLYEDKDLYRFLKDIERKFNIEIIKLCYGATPYELELKDKFVYNSRVARCSVQLKSKIFMKWLKENFKENECILYFGIDFSESQRCEKIIKHYLPYKVEFPLCKELEYKNEYFNELSFDGIELPRLYRIGLSHNNCKGKCVKAGIGHYIKLLMHDKETFLEAEEEEQELRKIIGKDVAHLKRFGKPYTLKQLREDYEKEFPLFSQDELYDIGGCNCFEE